MKTILSLILFWAAPAFASQAECALNAMKFNEKHGSKASIAFNFSPEQAPALLVRGAVTGLEMGADLNTVARICITAGMRQNIYFSDKGAKRAKRRCDVTNLNQMANVCTNGDFPIWPRELNTDLK